ncbi:TPA: hypothetical protein ACOSCG_003258, partial [Escherichia coli]
MITHYDIKTETQKLKDVLSVEGVNIPPLLQVIKPGGYVFLWALLWPAFLRLLADKVDIRDAGFDICFSGVMGFILFVAITKEGANKQVISSQADSLIKISRIWADFFPANTSNQP